jgi:uncharacterized protein
MTSLPERRIALRYPDDFDPAWSPRTPELAAAANSVSLIMPYAEPYFVRSARRALDQLDEPLANQTEAYARQELAHHVQHRRFNQHVAARYRGVTRLESLMRRAYGWLDRTRSLRFNLAFAAGSETLAFSIARWTDRRSGTLLRGADPVAATLFLWHLAEEVEHKSAAYEVYEAVDGSRLRYLFATWLSVWLLLGFTVAGTLLQLHGERRLWNPVAWFRLTVWAVSLSFEVLTNVVLSALPKHHPSQLADPTWLRAWLAQYDPQTDTLPEPSFLAA